MSSRGEIIPELAALLRDIADRIESKTADPSDAYTLRKLATHADGKDKRFTLKVHASRGQAPLGAAGVDHRFAIAKAVKAYRQAHGGSLDDAFRALSGEFGHASGPSKIKKAWQEMGSLLEMSDERRNLLLGFKRLKARGFDVEITRTKQTNE